MNRRLTWLLLLVCGLVFAAGLGQLFQIRFEGGDVYPAYSSLRADPLGASAFYESLETLPGLAVSRDFSATDELPAGRNLAYLHLAGDEDAWRSLPEKTFQEIDAFTRRGGRLVITFKPVNSSFQQTRFIRAATNAAPARARSPRKKGVSSKELPWEKTVSLADRWGVDFAFVPIEANPDDTYGPVNVTNTNEPSLPPALAWRSGLVFTNLDPAWKVIYARRSHPVLIERRFGPGSVVFSTDTYFASNEAMRKDRKPQLLAWLIGPSRGVVFDEAHFGIVREPGIAALMRKYRLHGIVAGLLLLAGLFIWKNATSLAPARDADEADAHIAGKDSAAGFINLLRRNIPPSELLNLCLAEWKKSFPATPLAAEKLERVQAVIAAEHARAAGERDAVETYRKICRILKPGKMSNSPPPLKPTRIPPHTHTH